MGHPGDNRRIAIARDTARRGTARTYLHSARFFIVSRDSVEKKGEGGEEGRYGGTRAEISCSSLCVIARLES